MQKTILALATAALLAVNSGFAATLYWDTNGTTGGLGGTGNWNQSNLYWTADGGGTGGHVAWINANSDYGVFIGTPGTVTLTEDIVVRGTIAGSNGYVLDGTSTLKFSAISGNFATAMNGGTGTTTIDTSVVLENEPAPTTTADFWFRDSVTFNGVISDGDANHTLTVVDGSTLTLNAANNLSGIVRAYPGGNTLVIGHDNALGSAVLGWGDGSFLQAGGGNRTISGARDIGGWNWTHGMSGTNDLRFSGSVSFYTGAFSGRSTFNVVGSGKLIFDDLDPSPGYGGGYIKTGTGTMVVNQMNNFQHTTAVSVTAGTLIANGPFLAPVNVAAGATLGGNGSINGTVTVNAGTTNGTLAPGESVGTLTVNGTVDLNGTLEIEIDGSGADKLVVNGLLDLDPSTSVLNVVFINGFTPTGAETYDIADWSSLVGSFSQVNLVQPGGFFSWNTDNLLTDGTITLEIPEPASAALLALAGLVALRRRR